MIPPRYSIHVLINESLKLNPEPRIAVVKTFACHFQYWTIWMLTHFQEIDSIWVHWKCCHTYYQICYIHRVSRCTCNSDFDRTGFKYNSIQNFQLGIKSRSAGIPYRTSQRTMHVYWHFIWYTPYTESWLQCTNYWISLPKWCKYYFDTSPLGHCDILIRFSC